MPVARIADKCKMYDLFTRLLNRLKKDRDMEGIMHLEESMHLEECIELWTDMEIEEMEQDKNCDDNIRKMQNECSAWLDELGKVVASSFKAKYKKCI